MASPIPIGHSVRLIEVRDLAEAMGCTTEEAEQSLDAWEVPTQVFCRKVVVNLAGLEAALFDGLLPERFKGAGRKDAGDQSLFAQLVASLEYGIMDREALVRKLTSWVRGLQHQAKHGKFKWDAHEREREHNQQLCRNRYRKVRGGERTPSDGGRSGADSG